MEIKNRAILLSVTPFREKDAVVRFLCEDTGICPAIVRGFYSSKKKYGFALDYFNLLDIDLKKGRGSMYNLSWAEPLHVFEGIRSSLTAYGAAMMLLAVIRQISGHAPASGFNIVVNALNFIEQADEPWSASVLGILNYMKTHGFSLWEDTCANCGRSIKLPTGISVHGRPLCKTCCKNRCRHLSEDFLAVLQKGTASNTRALVKDLDFFVQAITEHSVNLERFLQLQAVK